MILTSRERELEVVEAVGEYGMLFKVFKYLGVVNELHLALLNRTLEVWAEES